MELSHDLKLLLEKGYDHMGKENVSHERNEEFERQRIIARKWRSVYGEGRFDIPQCLYQYVDWNMPVEWLAYKRPHMIRQHTFMIRIPNFCPISVSYKQFVNSADWYFHEFEILAPHSQQGQRVHSSRYHDLPLFLAMAREPKRPKKREIKFEEIEGGLADNAKTIKVSEIKKKETSQTTTTTGYVLTEADFLDCDSAADDGMPTYA